MATPALVPSLVYTFDAAACDAIIAEHYPDFETALDAWRSADSKANPDRYAAANTVMGALDQAERFLHTRIAAYEANLSDDDCDGDDLQPDDRPASDAELERALRDIIRTSRSAYHIRAAILRDERFTDDPDVNVDGSSVNISVFRADYKGVITVNEFFTLASDLSPIEGPSKEELRTALREMVRKSKNEAELRVLIASDSRFVGEPAITSHLPEDDTGRNARSIVIGLGGVTLGNGAMVMIMIHASHNGETIQI